MLAVDGDPASAWVSAPEDPAPSLMLDLGEPRLISRIEFEGRIPGGAVLQASDDFGFTNAKTLATSPTSQGGTLQIVKGVYGKDDKWIDVTEKLRAAADPDGIHVKTGISVAGVDPAPFIVKDTKVEYILDGKSGSVIVPEGGLLSLGAPHDWKVVLPTPVTARFLRMTCQHPGRCTVAEIRVFGPAK
jgi:hypothetical protein